MPVNQTGTNRSEAGIIVDANCESARARVGALAVTHCAKPLHNLCVVEVVRLRRTIPLMNIQDIIVEGKY